VGLRSPKQFLGLAMRAASLASRFFFTIIAAIGMTPNEFGIYALVTSASAMILQLAGLELYQIILRAVAKSERPLDDDRAHYGQFMIAAAVAAALAGALLSAWFGWSPTILLLTAAICAMEYIGTETQRICVVEHRPDLAMFSVSLRYLPWNLGLPVLYLIGVLPHEAWTIEIVLASWLMCSTLGCLFLFSVGRPYFMRAVTPFFPWFSYLSSQIPRWIIIALCYRFLESGMRMIPGIIISESAAGRFALLSTLASIGSTGIKAALEPFWFVRLIRADTGAEARKEFARVTLGFLMLAAIASTGALAIMNFTGKLVLHESDWVVFAVLVAGSWSLALSQIPHFALFAAEEDQAIQNSSIAVLLLTAPVAFVATALYGLMGTAIAVTFGSAGLLVCKMLATRHINPRF
jgi:O-antigen/teichoic acid export membrane protein